MQEVRSGYAEKSHSPTSAPTESKSTSPRSRAKDQPAPKSSAIERSTNNVKPATPAKSVESAKTEQSDKTPTATSAEPPQIGGGASPEALFDRLRTKALEADRSRFASLEGAEVVSIKGNLIELGVPGSFHVERLKARIGDLEALAETLFNQPVRISVSLRSDGARADEDSASREQTRKQRQAALNSEPVNLAIEVLEAEIVEIRPLGDNR